MNQRSKNKSGTHGALPDLDFSGSSLVHSEICLNFSDLSGVATVCWQSLISYCVSSGLLCRLRCFMLEKLIIDEIVLISVTAEGSAVENPDMSILTTLVLIELGLAVFSDLLGRGIALVDSLLGDLVSHEISLRLMHQSARLDLECF